MRHFPRVTTGAADTIYNVPALTFEEARRVVLETVASTLPPLGVEELPLGEAAGRVLARDYKADRDYPALARSVRDGYAVRAGDLPGTLQWAGEVRAGEQFPETLQPGQAIEIMTGAPVPDGADSVVMIEHCRVVGDRITPDRTIMARENIDPAGSMCHAGDVVAPRGRRIGAPEISMLASIGADPLLVHPRPRVAILSTGDELVEVREAPAPHQIRNSNAHALAVQVARAGGVPHILPIARDTMVSTIELIGDGLEADLLLISGGVSAGKYDVVERTLGTLGAEIYFERVLVQPGQPLVFGRCHGKFFFGLPGNPASTMVCFEVFARAALELLGGQSETSLPLTESTLSEPMQLRPGLTRFLPAHLSPDGRTVTPARWQGSGDVVALARANCYVVAAPDRKRYEAGERIRVLPR